MKMTVANSTSRDGEGVAFTSSKCPPESGLENTCELPFGFIWTPMADGSSSTGKDIPMIQYPAIADEDDDKKSSNKNSSSIETSDIVTSSLPPVLCTTCLVYLNPFVEIDEVAGTWTCPLCGEVNVLPKDWKSLLVALEHFQMEYHQDMLLETSLQKAAEQAAEEEDDDDVEGVRKLIGNDNDDDPEAKIGTENIDNLDDGPACTYVLVVDGNLPGTDALAIARAMEGFLSAHATESKDVQSKLRIGLVIFDQVVKMYQLGLPGVASADVYEGSSDEDGAGTGTGTGTGDEDDDDEALLKKKAAMDQRAYMMDLDLDDYRYSGTSKVSIELPNLRKCLSAVFDVDEDEPKPPISRMEQLKKKRMNRIKKQQMAQNGIQESTPAVPIESPWVKMHKDAPKRRPCRATGEAIQCAIDLTGVGETIAPTSRILLFTNGCPNVGEGSVVVEADRNPPILGKDGTAKQHDVVDPERMHKSLEYFENTANFAAESGICIDVFCSGANELGLPAYQALVEPSGGYVIPTSSFTTPHLPRNLNFLMGRTYPSRQFDVLADMLTDENEVTTMECILDIRTDSFIDPVQFVGPGEILDADAGTILDTELGAFTDGTVLAEEHGFDVSDLPSEEAVEMSMTRISLKRGDPLTTLGVMCQVNDTIEEDDEYAFFQLVCRSYDRSGKKLITRVSSYRFPIAKDVNDFVTSIDEEAVSVMLAKAAVYRAMHGREETDATRDKTTAGDTDMLEKLSYETQLDIDATIQRISGAYRLLCLESGRRSMEIANGDGSETKSSQSSLDFAFPPQLKEGLNRLYHLRRGPLISPGPMQSMDDRAEMRGLFLRLPLQACIGLMAPSMWTTGSMEGMAKPYGAMQPVPPETLALWDTSIVAADFYDSLFIWSGKNCSGPSYDEIRKNFKDFLHQQSLDRFPMPQIYVLFDGDSMSRRFTARLAPSHADPEDYQRAHFPSLENLSSNALERLRLKFKFYDASSDASFRKWFWSVSSATNASRTEGMSLCE